MAYTATSDMLLGWQACHLSPSCHSVLIHAATCDVRTKIGVVRVYTPSIAYIQVDGGIGSMNEHAGAELRHRVALLTSSRREMVTMEWKGGGGGGGYTNV